MSGALARPVIASARPRGAVGKPLLTVIVPAHNEERSIDGLLKTVLAVTYDKQVVIVDDASADATPEIAMYWTKEHACCELIRHTVNRGKGAAIRTGLGHARGQFTIIQDADLEYDPQDYPRLIEPLVAGEADVVYGSRYLQPAIQGKPSLVCRHGVSALNWAVRLLYGVRLTDEATCYKAFPTELLRRMDLRCERFEFCPEVTAKACRMGLRILEVPISYRPRTVAEGKKIRWRDGWEAAKTLWRYRHWTPGGSACAAPASLPLTPALSPEGRGSHATDSRTPFGVRRTWASGARPR